MRLRAAAVAFLVSLWAAPAWATSYFISPTGSDGNSGTSTGSPWLSPNHAVNCGDTLTAAAGTYSEANFDKTHWGAVTCPGANNVAWLQCVTFDACKIAATTGDGGIVVGTSFWGVQGWEITSSGPNNFVACFSAEPPTMVPTVIHHIIFANNVANGCQANGFTTFNLGTSSVDYSVIIGNIAYNAAQSNQECYSGISIGAPIASDTLAGTHIYIAGNFSFGNLDANPCAGGVPTDGEGIILDTISGGFTGNYAQQIVVDNNIAVFNGGRGMEIGGSRSRFAHVYFRHNTTYGNNNDPNQDAGECGDVTLFNFSKTELFAGLQATNGPNGCGAHAQYAMYVAQADATDHVYNSWFYSASGTNTGMANSAGFSYGPGNTTGSNPGFANPVAPSAPNCSGEASVPVCMSTVIANFAATAAKSYGYQIPSATQSLDPLFPQWLCNVNLPSGLITMGCLNGGVSSNISGVTLSPGVTIH